jgi:uridine kinase
MIDPSDVNLIIFDMDGTIVPSLPAVYEAIKRTFARLGWPVTFSAEDINRFFGAPATMGGGGLYEFITPPGSRLTQEEIREKVRQEEIVTFREMARPYPGVKETLTKLRRRGYKLAQYTNASIFYFNMVMSTIGTGKYFDHIETVHENNLTKAGLIEKIREKFGGLPAAVVGDRIHDVEAARATGSLSVGALYGYGGDETVKSDITIKNFEELLTIFDRRRPIFEKIAREIEGKKDKNRPFLIGISGIDGAGKTRFAGDLEKFLIDRNYETQAIRLDDFHNPEAVRYAGDDQAENYYNRSFNISLIVERLLKPLRRKTNFSIKLKLLDWPTDKYDVEQDFSFSQKTVVIFEGVFLFRKELAPYIDYKIHLDITFAESKRRAKDRDPEAVLEKYDKKYLPAQAKYLKEYPPDKTADMVIDNSDWHQPRLQQVPNE